MGDMLDKILTPLRAPSQSSIQDDAISEEVFDKEKTPRPGSRSSTKSTVVVRSWEECLGNNKGQWKAIAIKDAEERKKNNPDSEKPPQDSERQSKSTEPEKPEASKESKQDTTKDSKESPPTPKVPLLEDSTVLDEGISRQTSTTGLPTVSRTTSTSGLFSNIMKTRPRIVSRQTSTSGLFRESSLKTSGRAGWRNKVTTSTSAGTDTEGLGNGDDNALGVSDTEMDVSYT